MKLTIPFVPLLLLGGHLLAEPLSLQAQTPPLSKPTHTFAIGEKDFRNPPQSARPLIIWQWMNGVVSREGITADLEAYKKAGLGGVQNFQIGGPGQALADDPSVQIGNEKWRELLRFAMDECARLGLTFGTHNCPGWSSSAAPSVKAEDSMQKLIWTERPVPQCEILTPRASSRNAVIYECKDAHLEIVG